MDAALVIRYFGSKQDLFATATEFAIELPDLTEADPDDIADMLLPRYFAVWEDDQSFLALLRAAMTSRVAADTLNETLATHVAPTLMAATPDHHLERIAVTDAFVIGLATTRSVLANPPVASLSREELSRWAAPVFRQLLVGPAPGRNEQKRDPATPVQTRADILSAARSRFAAEGYERTTLRAVAADVGVDAALVIRYFGSKQELFAAAADFTIELPDLSRCRPRRDRGHTAAAVLRGMGGGRDVSGAPARRDDEPDRGRRAAAGVRRAGGAQADHRHPGSSGSADRADGCVRHRAGHHAIHLGQSTDRQPQPGRTQPLGGAGDPTTSGGAGTGASSDRVSSKVAIRH